ncbi:phage tail protein [Streptomyces sp. NPDC053367]|uniref:phage tail protein n=1 Tax=Streptomyces sp. NPDC053367 TaxID=3365700 RepID=UPI0037D39ED4
MAGDDVTITIRADSGDAVRAFRDVDGRLRDMRGRFVSESAIMSGSMNRLSSSITGVRGSIIPLAAAAVPLAAAMAPVAAKSLAAGAAVAAFGVAVAGQVGHLSDASKAQQKYADAVAQYGRGSKQAAEAARAQQATLAGMPAATAQASVAMQTLGRTFRDWSDSTAKFTMAPVEKSFTVLGELVPRLTPMVEGASTQLERLVDVAGGAVASPGFDALAEKLGTLTSGALEGAVDGVIRFARALSEGDVSGPIKTFMDYAERNGPAMRETLASVSDAVMNLVEAAADAGPGMLTLVNAAAGLVASLPPELVTILMQTAVALKAVSLAGAGAAAIAGGIASLGAQITALKAASVAAGGGLAGFNAALTTLSTGGKAALALGVVGGLSLAMHQLSDQKSPVAVDELSTALNTLASTGKVTGVLKTDFDEMTKSIAMMSKGASDNKLLKLTSDFGTWIGIATGPSISDARKNLDAWDKSMANLVKEGRFEEAAAQYDILKKAWQAGGGDLDRLKDTTNDYQNSLADAAFEQDHAAQSMGVFGAAAQDTEAKLAAQRQAADGLRASILALNDVNRSAHDAQTQFGAALDALTASFAEHGATLSADTEAGRANRDAMSAAAAAQDELIASGLAAGESLGSMTKKSSELREEMMRLALEAFDGNKQKATEYVNTLLGIPSDIKTMITAEKEEAISGLHSVQAEIEKTPRAKTVTVEALNGAAIAALEAVGLKTRQLPDGRTQVFTANGQALGSIGAVVAALAALDGKTAQTYTTHNVTTIFKSVQASGGSNQSARNAAELASRGLLADGGLVPRYADGGDVQVAPNGLIRGPGGGRSDSILALFASGATGRISNTEYVVNAASTAKYLPLLEAINEDRLPKFAKGGKVSKAQERARAQAKAEAEARRDAMGDLGISHFGRMAGDRRSSFNSALARPDSLASLVSSLNEWASVIRKATHGSLEKGLLRALDSAGRKLIGWEKQLTQVGKELDKAKGRLSDLRSAASQLAGSVRSGVLSSASITRGAGGSGTVSLSSIMGGLIGSRDKATAFASALDQLRDKGLSSSLLRQVAEAGIEGGGLETAGALLGASSSEIKTMNDLQGQIAKAASAAGKTTADAVYAKAIAAQERLVKSLGAQQKDLLKSMDRLAGSMEKLIEAAFKRKGGKAAGGIVGAASGGIRSNLTWVGEHGPELLDLPAGARVWSNPDSRRMAQGAWASMLNTPRRGGAAVAPAAGRPEPVVIELRSSGSEVDEFLLKLLRRAINARGGNAQVVLTGRKQ